MRETAAQWFEQLPDRLTREQYNFAHFRREHLLADVRRTARPPRLGPGTVAPDFELPRVGGGSLRLSDLLGAPVLLRFGSFT